GSAVRAAAGRTTASAQSAAATDLRIDMRSPTPAPEVVFPAERVILSQYRGLFMKRILLAISLLLAVTGVQGAVQYEFRQTFHSDVESMPPNDMTGRAVIDGERYRVEFLSGTAFPAGTYVFSTHGARQQVWVDPSKKSYVEVNTASVASALGATRITITNKKVDLTQMPDHPIIAGL